MKHRRDAIWFAGLAAMVGLLTTGPGATARERGFFAIEPNREAEQNQDAAAPSIPPAVYECSGPIASVSDLGYEDVRTTSAVFGTSPGGGEGGQFDKTPLLSTKVELEKGTCLDAHLSALVGSNQSYGGSRLTLFQVTLTAPGAAPQHMMGHYETPYGIASPAVATEAERDVDMFASNFFQRAGDGPHELPPGSYYLDVWWAGAPPAAIGGAIGAAFTLKLYTR